MINFPKIKTKLNATILLKEEQHSRFRFELSIELLMVSSFCLIYCQ